MYARIEEERKETKERKKNTIKGNKRQRINKWNVKTRWLGYDDNDNNETDSALTVGSVKRHDDPGSIINSKLETGLQLGYRSDRREDATPER